MPKHARWSLVYLVVGAALILSTNQFGWAESWKVLGALFMGLGAGIWVGGQMKK